MSGQRKTCSACAYSWGLTPSSCAACLAESGQGPTHDAHSDSAATANATATDADANKYKQMFRQRALHVMAFFILTYVGVEVTLGGTPHSTATAPL